MNIDRMKILQGWFYSLIIGLVCLSMGQPLLAQESNVEESVSETLDQFEQESPVVSAELEQQLFLNRLETVRPTPIMLDTLELQDMDIKDVLKLISDKSGLNIVAGEDVEGKTTIYLQDVDAREALKIILESHDLAFAEQGGIIQVMTAENFKIKYGYQFGETMTTRIIPLVHASPSQMAMALNQIKSSSGRIMSDEDTQTLLLMDAPSQLDEMELFIKSVDLPMETKVFDLNYVEAAYIAEKISDVLTLGIGRIKFDNRSNKVIVTDTVVKVEAISRLIEAFDQKEKEVLIESKIVQIVLSDEHKMGVDWEAIVSDYHSLKLSGDGGVLINGQRTGQLSVGTISNEDYTILLEALETVGETNVISNPRIKTLNNKEAKILVGSTEPYVTTTTTIPSSGPSTTTESVNFIDVGVKLYVTPSVHSDDYITMKIKPEVSSIVRTLTTGTKNIIPVVETSEAETTLRAKDGFTIVIGGLIKEEKVDSFRKVPLLGDLPLLGFAFRNERERIRKTEFVIFLTPKIILGETISQKTESDLVP